MTENELRKLSRSNLLQMLLDQSKELEALKQKFAAAEAALRDKQIIIDEAGSIAEASLQLNGVFAAAQAACQQYTDNIAHLSQRQEAICAQMESESRKRAERIVAEAQANSRSMISAGNMPTKMTVSMSAKPLPGRTLKTSLTSP